MSFRLPVFDQTHLIIIRPLGQAKQICLPGMKEKLFLIITSNQQMLVRDALTIFDMCTDSSVVSAQEIY